MSGGLHTHTPTLSVSDSRGLSLRQVVFFRNTANAVAMPRTTRQRHDTAGRVDAEWDPRLWARAEASETLQPNLTTVYSVSGQLLLTDSVDAGWRLALLGEAGQVLEAWDGREVLRRTDYDALLRPIAISEQAQVVERFTYGGLEGTDANTCNQLVRHDDPAGARHLSNYGLLGSALTDTRQFLLDLQLPDWPLAVSERDALLEGSDLTTSYSFNALGESIGQTDAGGNSQRFTHTLAGQLKEAALQLAEAVGDQTLVSDIRYNAFGQVESETAGNGVITSSSHDPVSGRLVELTSVVTGKPPLQQLKYTYDPVGNLLQIEDIAQPIHFFANQQIDPIDRYSYDSLYQLIEASGREVKTGSSHGPALPNLQNLPPDPNQIANYTQTYDYDAAGNLLEMRHMGAQSFTRTMRVAPDSNRSLPEGESDADFAAGFDANGNLQALVRGQSLSWDARNQLRQVTSIKRDDGPDDTETYVYNSKGQRCRKVNSAHTGSRTLTCEVRYFPGLEIRTETNGEILHVITAQMGHNSVRVLHWAANKPAGIDNDHVRYSLSDHMSSSTLELDSQAGILSHERYYPFGGTAWWAAKSELEAHYKTIRYSGKERDATGLYYYGFRYYAPWLYRWISPDPGGKIDGLNFYRMVRNQPLGLRDEQGLVPTIATVPTTLLGSSVAATETLGSLGEAPFSYLTGNLAEHLAAVDAASQGRAEQVANNFEHKIVLNIFAKTAPKNPRAVEPSKYYNMFKKEEWSFQQNFKYEDSGKIFANDIARHQYSVVAKNSNFYGHLPSMIRRANVTNKTTLTETQDLESGSAELFTAFFTKTPNGKTTSRILEDFNLKAIRVRKEIKSKQTDFIVDVEPTVPFTKIITPTGATPATDAARAPLRASTTLTPLQRRLQAMRR